MSHSLRLAKPSKLLLAALLAVAITAGAAATWAMWSSSVTAGGHNLSSGDLNVELSGSAEIKHTAADDSVYPASPVLELRQGDVVEITQPVTVTVGGKNLQADMIVSMLNGYVPPVGTTEIGIYNDQDEPMVEPISVVTGQETLTLPRITSETPSLVLKMTTEVTEDELWVDPRTSTSLLGELSVELIQVRPSSEEPEGDHS